VLFDAKWRVVHRARRRVIKNPPPGRLWATFVAPFGSDAYGRFGGVKGYQPPFENALVARYERRKMPEETREQLSCPAGRRGATERGYV
jgi:hypothetical protein